MEPLQTQAPPAARMPTHLYALAAMVVLQLGQAVAKPLFGPLGVAGATSLRLVIAALVLLALTRPRLRGATPKQLGSALLLGVVSGAMTLTFAASIARIPLGVTATIEYLGPLTVAVLGSRRVQDVFWALVAGGGVALITLGVGTGDAALDPVGIGFAAAAAVCWGLYLIFTQRVGKTFDGFQGLALSITIGAVAVAPLGAAEGATGLAHASDPWWLLLHVALAAMLFPVIPYALEMAALRRMSPRVLGILFSLEPAIAALVGFFALSQGLHGAQIAGIALVTSASVAVSLTSRK